MKKLSAILAGVVLFGGLSFAAPILKQDTKAPAAKQAAKPAMVNVKPDGKTSAKPAVKSAAKPAKSTTAPAKAIKKVPAKKTPAKKATK